MLTELPDATKRRTRRRRFLGASEFTGPRAWDAIDLAATPDATVRLHWTDAPYRWLVHDGAGVFVALDGVVDMHSGPTRLSSSSGSHQVVSVSPKWVTST